MTGRSATPFTGRTKELNLLRVVFDRAVSSRRAWRLTVTGEPGIGKSRLAPQFAGQIPAEARVLTGRGPAYGDGITFWPLREMVLEATGERGHQGVLDLLAGEEARDSVAVQFSAAVGLTERAEPGEGLFPPSGASSKCLPDATRWWSSWRTCTGRSPCSSISSNTSAGPLGDRCCFSAWPVPNCSRPVRPGARTRTAARIWCSGRSPCRRVNGWWPFAWGTAGYRCTPCPRAADGSGQSPVPGAIAGRSTEPT